MQNWFCMPEMRTDESPPVTQAESRSSMGDFNDSAKLLEAMKDVEIVYLNDMNSPEATQTIIDAAKKSGVTKIIGATILGIYDEVIGEFGQMECQNGRPHRHKPPQRVGENHRRFRD